MPRKIGFTSDGGHLIEDPVKLTFLQRQGEQTVNSTRYVCEVKVGKKSKTFDLYLPDVLIHGSAPKRLQVAIWSMD
jgi:hypothetical protein